MLGDDDALAVLPEDQVRAFALSLDPAFAAQASNYVDRPHHPRY
jgi:hypothetical protein